LDIRFNGGGELKNSILLYTYLANNPFHFTKQLEMSSISPPTYLHLTNYNKALKYGPINRKGAFKKSEGVFEISGHFSQKLQELNKDHFNGKLIVMINGNTASAAGALASCVKNDKRGLIVGEENRDNYTGFSAGVPVILTLPYSGITVSIPIRKFTYAEGQDNGRGVIPDYFYASTAKNFFSHKDEQLNFLDELFKE
jgi:C-terminal processing protease CtpA/Prc